MTGKKTNLLQLYFDQIREFPLLSFEEELELAEKIQAGDKAALKKLIESNLRLVVKITRAYLTQDLTFMDLIQEGNLGLIHAAERFDPAKRVRFSTYASWWIRQSVTRFLANKRRLIRLPLRKEEMLRKVQKSYHLLSQRFTREPSQEEIAREAGVSTEDVTAILAVINGILSLDMHDSNSAGILDYHEDYTYNPERALMREASKDATMTVLNSLKAKEKEILMYRYQLNGTREQTLKNIGSLMGISPETVRQIELRAIKKIRTSPELCNHLK